MPEPIDSLTHFLAHYGLLIHCKPEMWDLWHNRHADEKTRKAVGRAFSVTTINRDHLQPHDAELASLVRDLHERSIDFGAHFNVMAWAATFKIVDAEGGLATAGILALRVCGVAFGEPFAKVGLHDRLLALSAASTDLFDSHFPKAASRDEKD